VSPRAISVPAFKPIANNYPSPTNPLGVKGAGGATGAPAVMMLNAILDALAPLGVTNLDMPATPERIWQSINARRARQCCS